MPPRLNGTDISAKHEYLAQHHPNWSASMATIRNKGGPWPCKNGCASLLIYRCSVCGRDLAAESNHTRQSVARG